MVVVPLTPMPSRPQHCQDRGAKWFTALVVVEEDPGAPALLPVTSWREEDSSPLVKVRIPRDQRPYPLLRTWPIVVTYLRQPREERDG
jgi:hypothetical protein